MAAEKDATFGELLLQGAREALAYERGDPDVVGRTKVTRRRLNLDELRVREPGGLASETIRRIRDRLGLSQAVFADVLNVSLSTVRAWEQGQRTPEGPSLRLLEVADQEPEALLRLAALEPRA